MAKKRYWTECQLKTPPKRKKESNLVKEINQTQDQRYHLGKPVRKPREIETCDKSGGFCRRFSRMEISFLIYLTLVSNKNDETPRILHTNSRSHSHTHPHSQYTMNKTASSWIEKERESERERERDLSSKRLQEKEKESETHTTDSVTERKVGESKRKKVHTLPECRNKL